MAGDPKHFHDQVRLYEAADHIMFRAVDPHGNVPRIIKTPRTSRPSPWERASLAKEFEVTRKLSLSVPGVLRPLVLSEYDESLCLVFNDFPGRPLSSVLEGRPLPDLHLFFTMATELAGLLANIHAHHVIHRDLRPSNLLYSGMDGGDSLRLYNFSKASTLQTERPEVMEHRPEFGALAYISPELTGRMNRTVDHRSDLYSLGVIFYQLLSGRVPFTSDDPMELVHCHIAKAPPPIGPIRRALWPANTPQGADIPEPLAQLVTKLLAKGQEDRYQTAEGLVCDLQRCQSDYDQSGTITPFDLGSLDSSGQLTIPQKLYGRDQEIATLTTLVQGISTSKTRLVLVHGAAGIGKTSLVNELHRHIFVQQGLLVSGKYEQFQSDVPYLGLRRAFADYSHQLLKLDPTALETWRDLVWQKLGPNVALMTEVFPDLRPCLGDPSPLAALNNAEEQNRFHMTLVNFISEITKEQPLVMFLDDLQWADGASIRILETLLDNKHLDHLLIIGSYRSNEVTAAHSLQMSLNGLRQRGVEILEITLGPFDLATTNQFIAEIVASDPERTAALAALVFRKTAGNQFFTTELIRDLARSGMLAFDPSKRCWTWNLAAIEQVQVAPNIAQLMVERLERLSPEALRLIKVSACVGAKFDLKTISMATEQSPEVLAEVMWEIMESGVVVPLNSNYRMIDKISSHASGPIDDVNIFYQFQHDRVRAAAYSMLRDVDRVAAHHRIARLLLSRLSAADLQERIIEIVSHLNLGKDLTTDVQDRTDACRLNHLASTKATSSHAFAPALEYARIAHSMLPEHAWTTTYELAKEVTSQLSLCAYLANQVQEGESAATVLLLQVKTPLERAKVFQMQATNYNFLWDIDKSIRSSVAGLKELGIRISTHPSMFRILGELTSVKLALRGRSIQSIEEQSEIFDPKVKLALRLLISFVPPAYMSGNSNLFAVAVLIKTKLAIKYGHSEETAAAFSGYAALLAGMGDFGGAHEFGEMAVRLMERQNSLAWKSMTLNLYALFSLSWNRSWSELYPWFKRALDTGLESGDLLYTAFAGGFMNLWNPQLPLSDYIERQQKILELIRETRVGPGIMAADLQFVRALCIAGKTEAPASFSTTDIAEDQRLERMHAANYASGQAIFHSYKMQVLFLVGRYDEAANHMRLADKNMMSLAGSPYIVEHCLFSFLTQASRVPTLRGWAKAAAWLRIYYERYRMTKWSQRCPENFSHHAELMTAEIHRLQGKDRKASLHYGRALESLKRNKTLPYRGLIWERAGAFYTTWGDPNVASHYLRQAEYFYQTWAATICVDRLRVKYADLLGDSKQSRVGEPLDPLPTSSARAGERLDLTTVIKASNAISREINVDYLLEKILSLVVENTGAEYGSLLIRRSDQWFLAAHGSVDTVTVSETPISQTPDLILTSLVNYVLKTGTWTVIDDALEHPDYQFDPLVKRHRLRSVFCAPIVHQGHTVGLWFLENRLTPGAFTVARIELVKMLSSQFAISLENATLYQNLERKVKERTKELSEALHELKATQVQLVESEKYAALGGLVKGLAHAMNTPIGVTLTGASTIKALAAEFHVLVEKGLKKSNLTEFVQSVDETADLVERSAIKAKSLVETFQQIAVSESTEDAQDINIAAVAKVVSESFSSRLKKASVRVVIDDSSEVMIHSHFSALTQVLSQLMTNALDHAFRGRSEGLVRISAKSSEQEDIITFEDDGVGIQVADQDHLFDPFFTTDRFGGHSGLGLHIVYNLVTQRLGGQIACESLEGTFSRFIIRLPKHIATDTKHRTA